jgi:hypothetical protein
MKALTRRTFAGIAGASVAIATTPIAAASTTAADEADRLYRRYISMIPERRRLDAAYDEAEQQIPEWARSGPILITKDGTFKGGTIGWPRDVSIKPAPYLDKICRPSPTYLRKRYETFITDHLPWKTLTETDALRWYRKELRALVQRCRAQQAEKDRVGLAAKEAAIDRQYDLMWDIKDEIAALSPSMNSLAALLLLEAKSKRTDSYVHEMESYHFDHMQPHLSGLIAEHVDIFLAAMQDDPFPYLRDMPFYG